MTVDEQKPHLEPRARRWTTPTPDSGERVYSEEHRKLVEERRDPLPIKYDSNARNGGKRAITVRMSDVQLQQIEWLWPGWLAAGKLSLLEGKPSLGKSTLALTLAARVSTGTAFPDETPGTRREPRNVLLLSAEDSAGDTLKPRLLEAGADCERIELMQGVMLEGEDGAERAGMVLLPRDLDVLEDHVRQHNTALVVMDVLAAYTGSNNGQNPNNDASIRTMLNPLTHMLDRTRAHGLAIRHWTKAGDDDLVMRGGGSIAYAAAARHIYACVQHPENEQLYVLVCAKNNLAPKADPLSYSIVEGDHYNTARLRWRGPIDITVQELMRRRRDEQPQDDASTGERCKAWLYTALMDGPVLQRQLMGAAADQGYSKSTLYRAADDLHVVRGERAEQHDGVRRAVWRLPDDA